MLSFIVDKMLLAHVMGGGGGGRFHMRVEAWYRLTTSHHPAQFLK